MRRVVVTGVGCVTALGPTTQDLLAGLRAGECGIGPMTVFSTEGFRTDRAAVAPEIELGTWLPESIRRRVTRSDTLALAAAREAWEASGIGDSGVRSERIGVTMGGTTGGIYEAEDVVRERSAGELSVMPIRRLANMPVHSSAETIARAFGCLGDRASVSTACSSSANAIGLAMDAVAEGRMDAVLAGGTESHCRMTFAGFNALQALSPDFCRPFDRNRNGLSLGEGAALLLLEAEELARARGARILAEVAGYGVSGDAHHMTAPHPEGAGAALAMRRALADAGVSAADVDYVNAHGTGTVHNDLAETRALAEVFGTHARTLAISSTKSQVGHCLGAAGAVEIAATTLAIDQSFAPPTIHLEEPDPDCDLDFVPGAARDLSIDVALSCSYGFGGNNTAVVLRRHE